MENNLFEMLSGMMGKNNTQNTQTQPPPEHQVRAESYYPPEAYTTPQQQQHNGYTGTEQATENTASTGMNANSLLPMIMSLMGQNGSQMGALSKIFSGGDPSALANLLKPQKNTKQEPEPEVVLEAEPTPQDDILL